MEFNSAPKDVDHNHFKSSLIEANRETALKITYSLCKKKNIPFLKDDIRSLSDLALCEAAETFDIERKTSFVTHLYYQLLTTLRHEKAFQFNRSITLIGETEVQDIPNLNQSSPETTSDARSALKKIRDFIRTRPTIDRLLIEEVILCGCRLSALSKRTGYNRTYLSERKASLQRLLKGLITDPKWAA